MTELESGLIIPDHVNNVAYYGRVLSVGEKVTEVDIGDIVVYVKAGADQVHMDEFTKADHAKGEGFVAVSEAMIQAKLTDDYARAMGLRVDDID